jgi:hypothetical protein
MNTEYHRVLFVFVDGVGLAPASADNPLSTVEMPALAALLGGSMTSEREQSRPELLLKGIDACLGVEGLPQSASGQTSLLTGVNGAELMGRHMTAFPGPTLRTAIEEKSLFLQLRDAGLETTFANAYTDGYLRRLGDGTWRASVTTRAVEAAALPFRVVEHLLRGEAVAWDIERDLFARRAEVEVPGIGAREAGRHLAQIAAGHDLTLFETFLTDVAGHGRWGIAPEEALRRLDGLLAGVLQKLDPGVTLLVTSDHGNIEDATTRSHTLNPVPLLVSGPLASELAGVESIVEVTPRLVELLAPARPERVPT